MITAKKWEQLRDRMRTLKIYESELDENFIIGSGHGGQKLQKTASCVFLKHIPTGIQIKCQKSRLRDSNRYFARHLLCQKIDVVINKEKSQQQQAIEKIRRQKRKRSKRAKEKILTDKKIQSTRKINRKSPSSDDY